MMKLFSDTMPRIRMARMSLLVVGWHSIFRNGSFENDYGEATTNIKDRTSDIALRKRF
jgi:hypothetical protein